MLSKHKQPSLEAGLLIIIIVISIFSIGFLSEGKITGMTVKEESLEKVTGNMVKVTGMSVQEPIDNKITGLVIEEFSIQSGTYIYDSNKKSWLKDGKDIRNDDPANRLLLDLTNGQSVSREEGINNLAKAYHVSYKGKTYYTLYDSQKDSFLRSTAGIQDSYSREIEVDDEYWPTLNSKVKYDFVSNKWVVIGEPIPDNPEITTHYVAPTDKAASYLTENGAQLSYEEGIKAISNTKEQVWIDRGLGEEEFNTGNSVEAIRFNSYAMKDPAFVSTQKLAAAPAPSSAITAIAGLGTDSSKAFIEGNDGNVYPTTATLPTGVTKKGDLTYGQATQKLAAAPTTANLDTKFQEALNYWREYVPTKIKLDITSLSKLEGISMDKLESIDWAQIQANADIREATINAKSAEQHVKEAFIALVDTMKEQDRLAAENKWTEAQQLEGKIDGLVKVYQKAAEVYETAYNNYDRKTYTVDRALNDLYSTDSQTKQRAINKLEEEYYNAKTDQERNEISNEVYSIANDLYYQGFNPVSDLELLNKFKQIKSGQEIAAIYGARYNQDGSFTDKQGAKGWGFDPITGLINPSVKQPQTVAQQQQMQIDLKKEFVDRYNQGKKAEDQLSLRDGKIYDANGNLIVNIAHTIGKEYFFERKAPESIIIDGRTIKLKEGYKTKDGLAIYEDPVTKKIYTQKYGISDADSKSLETGVLIKTTSYGDKVKIEEELNIDKGKIQKEPSKTILVGIDTNKGETRTEINPLIKKNLEDALKKAGKNVVISGNLEKGNSLTINDEKGTQEKQTIITRVDDNKFKFETDMEINSEGDFKPTNKITIDTNSQEQERLTFDTNRDGKIDEKDNADGIHTFHQKEIAGSNGKFDADDAKLEVTTYDQSKVTADKGEMPIEKIVYDKKTMKPLEASKWENDGWVLDKERTTNLQAQWESKKWFSNFEFKLTQFKGLSGWSQLIFSDEELASWREGVDKLFSTFYLGTDYWVSAICSKHIPKQQQGTFLMETKDGLFDVVAHVEGEKVAATGPEGTQYLYKITFSVRNPKYSQYDKLKFNVYLYGDKTVQLYSEDIEVEDGKEFIRGSGKIENGQTTYDDQHGKPIVQYSTFNYNKICIKFKQGITNAKGKIEDEVCNSIVEYKGKPEEYKRKVLGTTSLGTTITGEISDPYQEADF